MKELILAFLDDDGNLTRTETVKNSIGGTGKEEAVLGRNMSSSCILWLKPFTGALPKRPLRPQGA